MYMKRTIKIGDGYVEQGLCTVAFVVNVSIGSSDISTVQETHARVYDILDTADKVLPMEGWDAVAYHGQLKVKIRAIK